MYTVPIKLWVDKLLSKCARTDMTNTFLMPQTMSNSVTLQNNSLDLHEVPSQEHTGATHEIVFTDSHSRPLGKLQAIRTNTDATGVQLEVNGNTLGLQVSDEGIPTSFVNHPYPDGPANQIATMKYVADWGKYLEEYLYQVKTLLDRTRADIQTIQESVALLDKLRNIDDIPTEGSNNLVKSGGIYSFVISRLGTGLNELRAGLNDLRAELLNALRNSSAGLIDSSSNYLKVRFGNEEWLLQWFVLGNSGSGNWPAGSYTRTPLAIVSPSWPGGGHYAVDHVDNLSFNNTSYSFEKYERGGSATIFAFGRTN